VLSQNVLFDVVNYPQEYNHSVQQHTSRCL